ncbi:hypothetical protein HYH03_018880 [Edaphochlamys debaryana]|uniref:Uncharacterized protein n=1 Tax=Edaphochlamys debaryana TaxID=47281 RepID=A0A836BMP6_9CHLO|nr:hypothetical protein HYH03_018880 [Edaphochlamys debaryana]|eukprot:KAG2482170.1 hypothetical protein HYH03_018880 [Edaphochlamys debaryana]
MVEGRTSREAAGGAGPKTWRLVVEVDGRQHSANTGGWGESPADQRARDRGKEEAALGPFYFGLPAPAPRPTMYSCSGV